MTVWVNLIAHVIVLLFTLFASIKIMMLSDYNVVAKFIALIVLILALYLILRRDTYLPFLGYAAFPNSLIPNDFAPVGSDTEVNVHFAAPDRTRVIYWGAMPSDKSGNTYSDPKSAYGNFANAGVATVKNGEATIRFSCPGQYMVPGRKLKRHLHYRFCYGTSGLLGPVQTMWVTC